MLTRVTNGFFEENLESILGRKIDLAPLEREFRNLLERTVLAPPASSGPLPPEDTSKDILVEEI